MYQNLRESVYDRKAHKHKIKAQLQGFSLTISHSIRAGDLLKPTNPVVITYSPRIARGVVAT